MPEKRKTLLERITSPFRRTASPAPTETKVEADGLSKQALTREEILSVLSNTDKKEIIDTIQLEKAKTYMREAGTDVVTNTTTALFRTTTPNEMQEKDLYNIYRQMDNDAVISAALDLFADNATQVNTKTGHVVSVESGNKNFQEEINQFLWDVAKMDTEAWNYARAIAQYGKLVIDTKASNGGRDWAFIELDKPELVQPLTYGQDIIKYFAVTQDPDEKLESQHSMQQAYNYGNNSEGGIKIEFRDRYIVGFNNRKHIGKIKVMSNNVITGEEEVEDLYIRTGKSFLEGIIETWRMLSTLEDSMFINRLVKSNAFNLVTIDVSDSTNKQSQEMIDSVKRSLRSAETIDKTAERYTNRTSPIPARDFVYIPVKGEKGSVTIEQVGGEVGTQDLTDIDYYRNKLFAGLGVLKAYLGFEETMPGGLGGDATLTMLDERFTRKVKRLRQSLSQVARQIVEYYWVNSSLDRTRENMPEFKVVLGKLSTQEEAANRAELLDNFNVANEILNITGAFPDRLDEDKLFNYIFNDVIGIDPANFDNTPETQEIKVIARKLQEAEGSKALRQQAAKAKAGKEIMEKKLQEHRRRNRPKISKVAQEKSFPVMTGKIKDLIENTPLTELLKEWTIQLDDGGVITTLHSALDNKYLRQTLTEATYKDLKQRTQIMDPLRIKKSKKLTGKYLGIDDDLFITFRVTAEDPAKNRQEGKPTSYETKVHLKALLDIIKARRAGETDIKLLRDAVAEDVAVACECPASKYWGQQYNGTKDGYSIVKNTIEPTRNKQYQVICKHVSLSLQILPFWTNTIVRDLRQKGYLTQGNPDKAKQEVPEDLVPTKKQDLTREPVLDEPEVKGNKPVQTKITKKQEKELEKEQQLKQLADKAPKTRKKKPAKEKAETTDTQKQTQEEEN